MRPPTAKERATIIHAVRETWEYESDPARLGKLAARFRRPRLHPFVVRIVVSRGQPRFASALVELRDRRRRGHGAPAVELFDLRHKLAEAGTTFPNACTHATPAGLRDVLCPDPWRVLRTTRPPIAPQRSLVQPIPTSNLHALDWRKITLPGASCGSSRPIHPTNDGPYRDEALVHPDVDLL